MTDNDRLLQQDILHVHTRFRRELGRELDLANPRTFNEKLQWLKLYRRPPGLNQLVDKWAVRRFVEQKVGSKHLNELFGVFENADELEAALGKLPRALVVKPNHWSGAVWRVQDKERFDWPQAKREMDAILGTSFYDTQQGEWCYRGIPPRLLAERFLKDQSGELRDYKCFCFDGTAHYVEVHVGRFDNHVASIYDVQWQKQPWALVRKSYAGDVPRPANLREMIGVAEALSCGHPFLRVDLYSVHGAVVFGELTFFPFSGWNAMLPPDVDLHLGSLICC